MIFPTLFLTSLSISSVLSAPAGRELLEERQLAAGLTTSITVSASIGVTAGSIAGDVAAISKFINLHLRLKKSISDFLRCIAQNPQPIWIEFWCQG